MKSSLLISFFFLFLVSSLSAQDGNVETIVEPDSVYIGNTFRLNLVATNINGQFDNISIDKCEIQGPMINSQFQIINGRSQSQIKYSYYLSPSETGKIIIPKIQFFSDDLEYWTEAKEIIVLENPDGIVQKIPESDASFSFPQFDSFFGQKNPTPEPTSKTLKNRKRRKI